MLEDQHTAFLANVDMVELLRAHGITPTHQRIEIAQILFAKPQHLSAEQILGLVNQQQALVSKATVYNTLGLFATQGLIREVIVDPTKVFYDSNTCSHHHFYNVDTGTLMDIESERVSLGALPTLPEGTVAAGVDVIIRVRNTVQDKPTHQ
ncbi:MAG TPA: Fur family transcriptional regulator [Gammaproteobacteria bacterium]|nr:Fur family transcriptional regulator [Gammaproteobacteria bacterium]